MSEEVIENEETPVEQGNPEEAKARASGWVPLAEWNGDPDEWVSAKAFNKQGELFSYIKKTNREVAELKTAVTTLNEVNRRIAEVERQKAIEEINAMRKDALRNQDIDTLDELNEKLADLKTAATEPVADPEIEKSKPNEVFLAWAENNSWYLENKVLQGAANAIGDELFATDERAKIDQRYLLAEIEKRIKQEFPAKFVDNRQKVSESGNSRSRSDVNSSKLDETTLGVLKKFVDDGTYKDMDTAIKSYKKYNQIK
jgi:hypothetical protein